MTNQHGKPVEAPQPGDATLASLFEQYCRATRELNAKGDIDNEHCPFLIAFQSASEAMRDAPNPTTTEGATLLLRFSLGMGAKKEVDDILISGSAADRAQFLTERRDTINDQEAAAWKALVGLEARLAAELLRFAEVWLGRWTGHGGQVAIDSRNDRKLAIFKPAYSLSIDAHSDAEVTEKLDVPEAVRAVRREWLSSFYDGKMRELEELLDAMPGSVACLKAIIAENPAAGFAAAVGQEAR